MVLKQPKTEGSIRNVYLPDTVVQKLIVLRRLQGKYKEELGLDGYSDYDMIICQANGRPLMTEHLNKRFKDILEQMGDPDISLDEVVFHSIRHTSTGVKLKLSNGDVKAVQGDGGWNTPEMVTRRYAHILDEDRRHLSTEMESKFYQKNKAPKDKPSVRTKPAPETVPKPTSAPQTAQETPSALDVNAIAAALTSNPSLLMQVLQFVQFANS